MPSLRAVPPGEHDEALTPRCELNFHSEASFAAPKQLPYLTMALRPRGAPAAAAREEEAVRATAATAVASRSASGGSGANGSDASGSDAASRAAAIAVDAPEVARACRVGSAINLAGVACGAGAAGGRGGAPVVPAGAVVHT